MKSHAPDNETALRQQLSSKGFEVASIDPQAKEGSIAVQADTLYPVSVGTVDPLYVPVPVTLQVTVDDNQQIQKIEGGTPSPDAAADAALFVKTLVDNNQVSGLSAQAATNATHQVEVNDKGQRVLKRRGFSLF